MTITHASRLLAWYDRHRRTLPWRAPAGERTEPYLVWLSEIMLQQTTVATVGDYFRRFVERWPTVEALAEASLDSVLSAWAGLGRYTAGAIRAIAFDQPASAVDGNVERVIARLFAIETPLPDAKPEIQVRAARLVPEERAGDYAQAMMDLGATVCTPRNPRCVICPFMTTCRARRLGIAEELPRRAPKAEKPTRRGLAFVLARKDGAILLRKRPAKGLLGGMDEVPSSPWREGKFTAADALAEAPVPARWQILDGLVRHTFTHFHLELTVARATATTDRLARLAPGTSWCTVDRMTERALPTVMRKVIAHAVKA